MRILPTLGAKRGVPGFWIPVDSQKWSPKAGDTPRLVLPYRNIARGTRSCLGSFLGILVCWRAFPAIWPVAPTKNSFRFVSNMAKFARIPLWIRFTEISTKVTKTKWDAGRFSLGKNSTSGRERAAHVAPACEMARQAPKIIIRALPRSRRRPSFHVSELKFLDDWQLPRRNRTHVCGRWRYLLVRRGIFPRAFGNVRSSSRATGRASLSGSWPHIGGSGAWAICFAWACSFSFD